jgi:membrane-associated phospholipid phosphatase
VFLVGTAALIATDKRTIGPVSNEHIDLNRNTSNAGIYGLGAAAGAILVAGVVAHDPHAQETGFLTAEALANAVPIYVGLQLIAGRERPNEGAGHGRFLQNHSINSSFPSGHALFAWTMASVIAHEYPRRWVKILVYGTATAVSVTRFTGREHFVSDVAVGSFLGYFIGRHIFHAHCSTEFSDACH